MCIHVHLVRINNLELIESTIPEVEVNQTKYAKAVSEPEIASNYFEIIQEPEIAYNYTETISNTVQLHNSKLDLIITKLDKTRGNPSDEEIKLVEKILKLTDQIDFQIEPDSINKRNNSNFEKQINFKPKKTKLQRSQFFECLQNYNSDNNDKRLTTSVPNIY